MLPRRPARWKRPGEALLNSAGGSDRGKVNREKFDAQPVVGEASEGMEGVGGDSPAGVGASEL